MIWLTLGIIISAIGGLLLTRYIDENKNSEDHMVCPIGGKCHSVVNGRFSKFFGISVEKIGTFYYGIIIVLYLSSIFRDLPSTVLLIGLLLSGIGFAFSMYLTLIQVFVLKKWCTLCLGSAAISFMIVVLAFLGFESIFVEFAYTYRDLLKWIYSIAIVGGTLMTTLHARIFIRFLKDFHISEKEEKRLEMFSHSAWVAIGLTSLSGLGLVLTDRWREFTDSNAFIVMIVIVGVLVVYEIVMNMIVSPKLVELHFDDSAEIEYEDHTMLRKTAFAMIGLGTVSWYSLLLLSGFNWFAYSSSQLFVGYVILIILAVGFTMFVEVMIQRKAERRHNTKVEKETL
jgi:uncharacterized membrane protein